MMTWNTGCVSARSVCVSSGTQRSDPVSHGPCVCVCVGGWAARLLLSAFTQHVFPLRPICERRSGDVPAGAAAVTGPMWGEIPVCGGGSQKTSLCRMKRNSPRPGGMRGSKWRTRFMSRRVSPQSAGRRLCFPSHLRPHG